MADADVAATPVADVVEVVVVAQCRFLTKINGSKKDRWRVRKHQFVCVSLSLLLSSRPSVTL